MKMASKTVVCKLTADADRIDQLRSDWEAQNPSLDTSGMEVVGRILIAAQMLRARVTRVLKPFGLDYSEFDVLATLRRSGPPHVLTPTELMQSVVLTSGAVTALLRRLEDRHLIAREADANDGRVRRAVLTEHGKHLVERVIGARFAEAADAVGGLTHTEIRTLADNLRTFNAWLALDEQDN